MSVSIERLFNGSTPTAVAVATAVEMADAGFNGELSAAADDMKRRICGPRVTFVVNRNINYTNVCAIDCAFCGYSVRAGDKGAYVLDIEQISSRIQDSLNLGITEVCITGGLNRALRLEYLTGIVTAIAERFPWIHIHAFSPMEVLWFSRKERISTREVLIRLKDAGLGSMPGTAAEILVDEVRRRVCPGKLKTAQWISIIKEAHSLGIPTTSTIMFGHLESAMDVAVHLIILKNIQVETGGFTEFVPLPFVSGNTALRDAALSMDTGRIMRVHSIARLLFGALIPNIQVSWTKMGVDFAKASLHAGASDLGGTLIEENITRMAGGGHGQYLSREELAGIISGEGLEPFERDTLYTRVKPAWRNA